MTTGRRRVMAVAAALLAVLAMVVITAAVPDRPAVDRRQGYAAIVSTAIAVWGDRQAQDALLRERLGGLSALMTTDPELAGCDPPASPLPTATGDQVARVRSQVEALRELTMDQPVDIRLLDDTAMTDEVSGFFARRWNAERLDHDRRVLLALGAIDPDTDLEKARVDLVADQVSGFFTGTDSVIGVRTRQPGTLTVLERVVLAHEVEHALTYQRLGRPPAGSADAARAATAVIEGSAALAMRWYAGAVLTGPERVALRAELLARVHPDPLASLSPYLREELRFPYQAGLRFVCARFQEGGWEAVNAAYADPPRTTAGVLFPSRRDEPARVPAPLGGPGPSWSRAHDTSLGAAELGWLLAAPGADPTVALADVRQRVGAWAGGALVLWTRGDQSAVGVALVDRGTGIPLCGSVAGWYAAAFPQAAATRDGERTEFRGQRQRAVLTCDGDQVRLGIAPTAAEAAAIAR